MEKVPYIRFSKFSYLYLCTTQFSLCIVKFGTKSSKMTQGEGSPSKSLCTGVTDTLACFQTKRWNLPNKFTVFPHIKMWINILNHICYLKSNVIYIQKLEIDFLKSILNGKQPYQTYRLQLCRKGKNLKVMTSEELSTVHIL